MPAVGSGESWKLFKQRHDLTSVCLGKIIAGRLEDDGQMSGWVDGLVGGWLVGWTDGWMDEQVDEWRAGWVWAEVWGWRQEDQSGGDPSPGKER